MITYVKSHPGNPLSRETLLQMNDFLLFFSSKIQLEEQYKYSTEWYLLSHKFSIITQEHFKRRNLFCIVRE